MRRDDFNKATQREINRQYAYANDGVIVLMLVTAAFYSIGFVYKNYYKGDSEARMIDEQLSDIFSGNSKSSSLSPTIILSSNKMFDRVNEQILDADFTLCFRFIHDYLKFPPRLVKDFNKYGQYNYVQVLNDKYTGAEFSGTEYVYARAKPKCENIDHNVSDFNTFPKRFVVN